VNFEQRGEADPTLIFVHGASCDLHDWDRQTASLSARFRTIALDLPGHGLSPPTADLSIPVLGALVADLARRQGGPAILIGHSAGCRVALEAAIQGDAAVVGVVFVDGSVLIGPEAHSAEATLRAKFEELGFEGYMQAMFGAMFAPGVEPAAQAAVLARAKAWDPATARAFLTGMVRWDAQHALAALGRLRIPSLALQCTYLDHLLRRRSLEAGVTTPWMQALEELAPQTRIEVVSGSGHFVQLERADLVNRMIAEFADSIRRGAAATSEGEACRSDV